MNIKKALSIYNIETDKWVRLTPTISEIILDQDATIYTDEDELYYFDSSSELMTLSKAYGYSNIKKENISTAYGSYKHSYILDMNRIVGFVSTTIMGPYGSYFERAF